MSDQQPDFLDVDASGSHRRIAVRQQAGNSGKPGVVWLGGFKSDMLGTKAEALAGWAAREDRAFLRFDYSGHGESGGNFSDGTIGRWLEESLAVIGAYCRGPQILVGSSMGGWIALLVAREWRKRATPAASVAGLVLIAPAVDFTEELMWKKFPAKIREQITREGLWTRPSDYDPAGYPITRALIEEGRNHLLLGSAIETGCPVRILQGVRDTDVPWQHAVDLVSRLAQDDVVLTLVKDGDHRLSRDEDIAQLLRTVESV